MEDFKVCPICASKFKVSNNAPLKIKGQHFVTTQKVCSSAVNHTLQTFVSSEGKILTLKLSLSHNYSRFVEINYVTDSTVIMCIKNGERKNLEIDRALSPDFPDLENLKKKVDFCINFS